MLLTHRPAAPLASHVDLIWFASRGPAAHSRERSLPTGRVDIVIPLLQQSIVRYERVESTDATHLHGAVVSGAHDHFSVRGMGGASSVMGVHFKPAGAAAFFGGVHGELRNRTVLLEALWGPMARQLRERLQAASSVSIKMRILEDALLLRLMNAASPDSMVTWALRALHRDPTAARIDAIQRASDCTAPRFIRRFDAAVGLTPKRYARVLRFNSLLPRIVRVGPRDWAELAVEGGFYDQAHLIHEFRRLAGVTPAAYLPVRPDQPTHVPVAGS